MKYTLLHKDIPVAEIDIDEDQGTLQRILSVSNLEHMPVGTLIKGAVDTTRLKSWWSGRSIPASRSGLRDMLECLEISDPRAILTKSMGLSLSDQYWVRPSDSGLLWSDVNFFANPFSEDVGDLLFGRTIDSGEIDLSSPDNTSDGVLKKRWKIIDGKRCLIKGSTGTVRQEPFNEIIASRICEALDIPHVDYGLVWIDERPFSVCEDFITPETELVSAYRIMQTRKKSNSDSFYTHYVKCCSELGVDAVPALDRMMVLDYIIANGDRHTNNFGLVRNAETLDWIGPAPVFDSGTSLGCDLLTDEIPFKAGADCKPFAKSFREQIKLVSSFDWIDFDAIGSALPDIRMILDSSRGSIDAARSEAIMNLIRSRIESIRRLA